jgi:hypothetical protein
MPKNPSDSEELKFLALGLDQGSIVYTTLANPTQIFSRFSVKNQAISLFTELSEQYNVVVSG